MLIIVPNGRNGDGSNHLGYLVVECIATADPANYGDDIVLTIHVASIARIEAALT
jgi:hypothetical protein